MPGVCSTMNSSSFMHSSWEPGHSLRPKRLKVHHDEKTNESETKGPVLLWKVTNRPDYTSVLHQPHDVLFKDDRIVVAEGLWPYSRIQLFNLHGLSQKIIGKGQVLPFGLALTSGAEIAATDHRDRTVKFLDMDNNQISSWDSDRFDWPNGITTNSHGQFLIADWSKGVVRICDQQGNQLDTIETKGKNEFSFPEYVIMDKQDHIYISDAYDHSVKVYDRLGNFLHRFGEEAGPGKIKDPRGLALDGYGNILVADWGGAAVKRYVANGKWLNDVLTSDQGIKYPWGIDYNAEKAMLVLTEHKLNCSPALELFHWDGS